MRLVYIAGPYRADTIHQVYHNIQTAREYALEVWRTGNAALCPHTNSGLMDGAASDEVFLEGGKRMLSACDIMLVLPGWEQSKGTKSEVLYAQGACIPCILADSLDDVEPMLDEATEARL